MPHRSKHEAQMRMAMRVARVAALQGGDSEEGLRVFRQHMATVEALEHAQTSREDRGTDVEAVGHSRRLSE